LFLHFTKGEIMSHLTGRTFGGTPWTPHFVTALDHEKCIGCGRCFKVCPRTVLTLIDSDEEDDEDVSAMAKMCIKDQNDCIGCGACGRACPKKCFSFAPLDV
jgi:Nif-specific ferredoxin III